MATCTVTGILEAADGKPRGGVSVRFVLADSFGTATESYIAGVEAKTRTDKTGAFELTVAVPASGTVSYEVYVDDDTTALLTANLSAAMSPVDLAALILDAGSAEDIDTIPSIVAAYLAPAFETLVDGATIIWDFDDAPLRNAKVTLGGNRALSITNTTSGAAGVLKVIQSTGGHTLTLPAGSKVINAGAGAVTLSAGAGDIDVLTFVYDGTDYLWTIGTDLT